MYNVTARPFDNAYDTRLDRRFSRLKHGDSAFVSADPRFQGLAPATRDVITQQYRGDYDLASQHVAHAVNTRRADKLPTWMREIHNHNQRRAWRTPT